MSTYKFRLNDYHAVSKADIAIEGITVLSGVNGCGKSTLSRWLYYIVNGMQRFDSIVYRRFVNSLLLVCRKYDRARRELSFYDEENIPASRDDRHNVLSPMAFSRFELRDVGDEAAVERTIDYYNGFVEMVVELLENLLASDESSVKKRRLLKFLDLDNDGELPPMDYASRFRTNCNKILESAKDEMRRDLKERPLKLLIESVRSEYDEEEKAPDNMSIEEEGVDLLAGGRLSMMLGLRRAIYIDTPLSIGNEGGNNRFWKELRSYMDDKAVELDVEGKKLLRRIKDTIHGEAKFVKSDYPFDDGGLRYFSADKTVEVDVERTATGFKTFIYLQRLLENGLLDNETLLLIDEPEVHLHPQWVVEYARILVLLSKRIGVKVMVASHNPDMVAAIQAVAKREEMEDKVHFYIAEQDADSARYEYHDLGCDVSAIFKSFNIALSRIETYGAGSI